MSYKFFENYPKVRSSFLKSEVPSDLTAGKSYEL